MSAFRLPYRPLGAMRLFLALLVVLQHYLQWCFQGPVQRVVMPFEPGSTAVLVFFFLSGFIVVEAADSVYAGRPVAFLTNRLLRIVPLYTSVVIVSFVVLHALGELFPLMDEQGRAIGNPLTWRNFGANLLLIVPLPGRFAVETDFPVLRIAWALRVELAFYVVVALLLIPGRVNRGIQFQNVFNAAATALLAMSIYHFLFRPAWNPLVHFAPYFCAGGAFHFVLRGSWYARGLLIAAIGTSAVFAFFQLDDGAATALRTSIGATTLFMCLVASCMALGAQTAKSPIDRVLGDLSYPVYVGHWLPLLVLASVGQVYGLSMGAKFAAVFMAIALPVGYFTAIEPAVAKVRMAVRGIAIR